MTFLYSLLIVLPTAVNGFPTLGIAAGMTGMNKYIPFKAPWNVYDFVSNNVFGWGAKTCGDYTDEEVAKTLGTVALGFVERVKAKTGDYRVMTVGPVGEKVCWGWNQGRKVVYFAGSRTKEQWADNPRCAIGLCDYKAVAKEVTDGLPSEFKSNEVIVVGFSRGNFFSSAYVNLYPDNVGMFLSVASPGHELDPTKGAWTAKIESIVDPVSMLNSPPEHFHFEKKLVAAIHNSRQYWKEVQAWAYGRSNLDDSYYPKSQNLVPTEDEINAILHCKNK